MGLFEDMRSLLEKAARSSLKFAFGSGVSARQGANAITEFVRDVWHPGATGGSRSINPNPYFDLLVGDRYPVGWTIERGNEGDDVDVVLSKVAGERGYSAIRFTNTSTTNTWDYTLTSDYVPIHADWIYHLDMMFRTGDTTGGTLIGKFEYYTFDKQLVGTEQISASDASYANDTWHQLDGAISAINASNGDATVRFVRVVLDVTIGSDTYFDLDEARLGRIPELCQFTMSSTVGSLAGSDNHFIDFDGTAFDRSGGATTATLGTDTTIGNTTAEWTAPYNMTVRIGMYVLWSGGPNSTEGTIHLNDTESAVVTFADNKNSGRSAGASYLLDVAKGDTIKMAAWHDSGSSETLQAETTLIIEEIPHW